MWSKMRTFWGGVTVWCALVFWAQVPAYADDITDCIASEPVRQVAACSRIARNPEVSQRNRGLAFYNRGRGNLSRRHFKTATSDFSRALRFLGEDPQAYFGRGVAYVHRGEYVRAVKDFSSAVDLDPSFVKAYYNRAFAYERLGESNLARSDHRRVLELDPTLENSQKALDRLSAAFNGHACAGVAASGQGCRQQT